jgi:wyosine [tRNA(Phe)-imidazoG37] synthetase (radical SAM superfamily)
LLWRKEVRAAVALADVVLPSLDAPDPKRFKFINRPHPEITFARLVEGLEAFRREFSGQYWLEVMLLGGYTSLPAQVRQLANWARRIRPDKVQLNTAVRPPAEEYAMVVPPERLAQLARMFELPTEVVAEHRGRRVSAQVQASGEAILALLLRRPCTVEDIAHGLGMKPSEAVKSLADMEVQGKVLSRWRGLECFYHATTSRSTPGPGSCRKKPRRTPGRALSS